MTHPVTLEALMIYPIKSFRGISLSSATACESGLKYDRQWALIKADGHPLTQRKAPQLAAIDLSLEAGGITLSAEGYGSVTLEENAGAEEIECSVGKDRCAAQPATDEANRWISEVLESSEPLQFARISGSRQFHEPSRFGIEGRYFSDAAPYLVTSTSSLGRLNDTLRAHGHRQVDMRRFRPNLVISGLPAFKEHDYRHLDASPEARFQLVDACQRCVMTTVDPDSGKLDKSGQPLRLLPSLNAMPDNPKAPAFGVNSTLKAPPAGITLSLGQTLNLS